VLLEAVFSCRITSCRARVAIVADVRLVIRVMGITVAFYRVGSGAVVIAGGKVAKVVVCDGLTVDLLERYLLSVHQGHAILSCHRI